MAYSMSKRNFARLVVVQNIELSSESIDPMQKPAREQGLNTGVGY